MNPFIVAFNYLISLDESSEYTNDPKDPGGPTKWGVTKGAYEQFFRRHVDPPEIEAMTASTAKVIYATDYWKPLCCGEIQDLAFQVAIFDCGVLYGVGTTAFLVQRAMRSRGADIKLDGIFGDKSVETLNQLIGGGPVFRHAVMVSIHDLLLARIDAIISASPEKEKFRNGWVRRADRLLDLLKEETLKPYKNEEMF
jgi:lysozyme family protein